jgi:hypothetical protein
MVTKQYVNNDDLKNLPSEEKQSRFEELTSIDKDFSKRSLLRKFQKNSHYTSESMLENYKKN